MPICCIGGDFIVTSDHDVLVVYNLFNGNQERVQVPCLPQPENNSKKQEEQDIILAKHFVREEMFVTADSDKTLSIFKTSPELNWVLIKQFKTERRASHVMLNDKGKTVIAVDKTGDVYAFDVESDASGSKGKMILGHLSIVLDIALTWSLPSYIITCDRDEKIRVSNFPNSYNINSFCLGHREFVSSIVVLEEDLLVSGSGDGSLRLWKISSGRELFRIEVGHPVKQIINLKRNLLLVSFYTHPVVHLYQYSKKPAFLKLTDKFNVFSQVIQMHSINEFDVIVVQTEGLSLWRLGSERLALSTDPSSLTSVLKQVQGSQEFLNFIQSIPSDEEQLKSLKKEAYNNVQEYLQKKTQRELEQQSKKLKKQSVVEALQEQESQ